MKPKSLRRGKVVRDIKAVRAATAVDTIGDLSPGCEIFILTYGQFSLVDVVAAILPQTGPADLILSTWTAGIADLTLCGRLLEDSGLKSLRMVVDRSFENRHPSYCQQMRDLFGDDSIRTWQGHAKFAVIRGRKRSVAIRTSMNLNNNPRVETLEISDDPKLCKFLESVVLDHFQEQEPGVFTGAGLPKLSGVKFADKQTIKTGKATASPTPKTKFRIG